MKVRWAGKSFLSLCLLCPAAPPSEGLLWGPDHCGLDEGAHHVKATFVLYAISILGSTFSPGLASPSIFLIVLLHPFQLLWESLSPASFLGSGLTPSSSKELRALGPISPKISDLNPLTSLFNSSSDNYFLAIKHTHKKHIISESVGQQKVLKELTWPLQSTLIEAMSHLSILFYFLLTLASPMARIYLQELLSTRQPLTKSPFILSNSLMVAVGWRTRLPNKGTLPQRDTTCIIKLAFNPVAVGPWHLYGISASHRLESPNSQTPITL